MNETQELLPMPEWMDEAAGVLDRMAATGLACRDIKQGFRKIFMAAQCVSLLRGALTDEVMEPIMDLHGSAIGFRTDKDSSLRVFWDKEGKKCRTGGYSVNEVREALISAVMSGLLPCGNQFNIISGRMYVTKEGFTYLLGQAGVQYTIVPGVPREPKADESIVDVTIEWSYGKTEGKQTLEIPVRVNKGQGSDAILGKAERKAKAWLWNHLMHSKLTDGDTENDSIGTMRNVTPAAQPPAFLGGVEQAPAKGQDALVEPPFMNHVQVPQERYAQQEDEIPGLSPAQEDELFLKGEMESEAPQFGTPYGD